MLTPLSFEGFFKGCVLCAAPLTGSGCGKETKRNERVSLQKTRPVRGANFVLRIENVLVSFFLRNKGYTKPCLLYLLKGPGRFQKYTSLVPSKQIFLLASRIFSRVFSLTGFLRDTNKSRRAVLAAASTAPLLVFVSLKKPVSEKTREKIREANKKRRGTKSIGYDP